MSVKMSCVRVIHSIQTDRFSEKNEAGYYVAFYVQAYLSGFPGGARSRLKSFKSLDKCREYLNKLNAGHWMTDDDYHQAWVLTQELDGAAQLYGVLR